MARLSLKSGISIRNVGKLLFFLGRHLKELKKSSRGEAEADIDALQLAIEKLVTSYLFDGGPTVDKIDASHANQALSTLSGTVVRFHYDQKIDNVSLVNVVVPEIKGPKIDQLYTDLVERYGSRLEKLIEEKQSLTSDQYEDEFDLDDYAFESLGSIVILSCHG